ncbi:ABC transporter substrate-binding protein [Natronincola ferrireducens]|uniref:Glycine betaine/proline transport system substrate-binding protein n=1 Tax=Natronincola ferrireducens TaxID=393762 RepID=A0A1G9IT38_9FIRM|nr:ABC transporter substrate-binding protein [Natronincola ferrireducens]SDL28245.1 glycine betaine/proline transport system substrate-binding protein [Natronincola ferrireducens]
MNFLMKKSYKKVGVVLLSVLLFVLITGCTSEDAEKTIVFADPGWDSVAFHNEVASYIIQHGYGYGTEVEIGSTPITFTALRNGSVDVLMEAWTDNIKESYEEAIAKGEVIEASINFDDSAQGFYVPTYVIKGDPERGIEPMAPDLRTVQDLPKYWEVFKDREDPSKGRLYGAIPGWEIDGILQEKVKNSGLNETYNYFSPGSDAALASSIVGAYERGEAWVGYYWEPTWVIGQYDMTLLGDIPYDEEKWLDGYGTELPPVDVTIAIGSSLQEDAPEIAAFLQNYSTSSGITSEALAYMQENDGTTEETAIWFLNEYQQLWTTWVPEEVADLVKESLNK